MFGKKKTQNLKSSYLHYFMEKKSWNLKYKFKYGFSIVLCKKTAFFDFMQKGYSDTLRIEFSAKFQKANCQSDKPTTTSIFSSKTNILILTIVQIQ